MVLPVRVMLSCYDYRYGWSKFVAQHFAWRRIAVEGVAVVCEFDEEALRERLMDECGTAMFGGFPAALLDVADIESASSDELLEMAEHLGVDPEEY